MLSDTLHGLPILWLTLIVCALVYLGTALLWLLAERLARGERGRAWRSIQPALLPPLGIIFGLFVAFTAAQVWGDTARANEAVNGEASALRSVVVFAAELPPPLEQQIRGLLREYIEDAARREWPLMARRAAELGPAPRPLASALHLVLHFVPESAGAQVAQQQLASALERVLDARRQRILISLSQVNWLKWTCLLVQAACALLLVALVHAERRAALLALGIFATGVAACVLVIVAHDRPFIGQISVTPAPLLQVLADLRAPP